MIGFQLFTAPHIQLGNDIYASLTFMCINTDTLSTRLENVQIQHNVGAQKEGAETRYVVDEGARFRLERELLQGYVHIDKWLAKHSYPRLQLPVICGYIPLITKLADTLLVKK